MQKSTVRNPSRTIEVQNVSKEYQNGDQMIAILNDVSFSVNDGDFFAILGVSGSGKTTLLNIIGGLDRPSSGEVLISGKSITSMTEEERLRFRRDYLGFVFQFYNLLPMLTARENVQLGLELMSLPKSEIDERSAYYLKAVGLEQKAERFPSQLSGGEQQRVAIARALAKKPLLVLADEPTGNLDVATGRSIMNLMCELNSTLGTTFVVVTHDSELSALADDTYRVEAAVPAVAAPLLKAL